MLLARKSDGEDDAGVHAASVEGMRMADNHRSKRILTIGKVANPFKRQLTAGEGHALLSHPLSSRYIV